ncbi:CGNR zinc finger domain-containing protein [Agromyces sp. NPDC058126]|uniref:CGNR zinc finger domain-containing protein n=1 Tax=Agromyces sp. NPDC058126 TaxID=3346350 RepID=UPI0036D83940
MAVPVSYRRRERPFAQIGGAVGLDLMNTVSERLAADRFVDYLVDYDDVLRFVEESGLIDTEQAAALRALAAEHPADAADEWARVRELRETLYSACYEGGPTDPVVRLHAEAVASGALVSAGDGWDWSFPLDLALPRRRLALAAVQLLLRDDLDRLAQCADAECGWVFLDTSPRHNRRWCVAADCGNRNRVREFYARRQATSS